MDTKRWDRKRKGKQRVEEKVKLKGKDGTAVSLHRFSRL
jgi:hypothetical protein